MKYKINFINESYRRSYIEIWKEVMEAIHECYSKGDFVLRDQLLKFERSLAKFVGTKYAAGVSSGTDALKLSYKALGLKPGDEVITVSHVFIAPIQEIVHSGARPVLIDIGEDGLMDPDLIESSITEKTVGIVPVHLSGKVCEMDKIMKIAKKYNLWVVEDSCQALGAKYKGKSAGSWGDIGCFSHIAPKTLGIGGDGGSIVTNDKKLYEKILLLRNHWNITQGVLHGHQPKQPKVMDWGYNARLDNIHASTLLIKMRFYSRKLARRRQIAEMYNHGLSETQLLLPLQQKGQIYQEYICMPRTREERVKFCNFMRKKGVELLVRDTTPNHVMYKWFFGELSLPVTEKHAELSVRIPVYPELTDSEVEYIIERINEFYADGSVPKKTIIGRD